MQEFYRYLVANVIDLILVAAGVVLFLKVSKILGFVLAAIGAYEVIDFVVWHFRYRRRENHAGFEALTDLHGPITMIASEDGIEVRVPDQTSFYAWSDYVDMGEGRNILLLLRTENLFEIVPKRWFEEPAQSAAFRDFAVTSLYQSLGLDSTGQSR